MSGSQLNPQIALEAGQGTTAPVNLLATAGQAQQFQQNQLALQQQQRALGAQAALGQAYTDNTDKQGNINYAGVRAELAQSPAGSLALSTDNAGNTIAQGQGLASLQSTNLANASGRLSIFAHTLQGLITDQNVTPDKVKAAGQGLVDAGVFNQNQMDQELQNIPSDPQQLKSYLAAHQASTGQYLSQIGVQYPIGSVSTGAGTILGAQAPGYAPNAGAITPSQYVKSQLSPEFLNQQVTLKDGQGNPYTARMGDVLNQQQNSAAGFSGNGRYPGGSGAQASPAATEAPPPVPGAIATGPTPGTSESEETAGAAAGPVYQQALLDSGTPFQNRENAGNAAIGALQRLGPSGTGPGTEQRNAIQSYLVSAGLLKPDQNLTDYDEATKYLVQNTMSMPGAEQSDARLATALSGSPNTGHISNLAADNVLVASRALDRQRQAATLSFNQEDLPPSKFPSYMAQYTTKHDPAAFAFDLMTPQQKAYTWNNLSANEKPQFMSDVQEAQKFNLVKQPGQTPAGIVPAAPPQVPVGNGQ